MTVETELTPVPIDIESFEGVDESELGTPTNAEKVLRFLYVNDDLAFTPSEIADATAVKSNSVGTVLRRLEDRGLVRHRGTYWAIGDREAVRSAYSFHQAMDALEEEFGVETREDWGEHAAEPGDE